MLRSDSEFLQKPDEKYLILLWSKALKNFWKLLVIKMIRTGSRGGHKTINDKDTVWNEPDEGQSQKIPNAGNSYSEMQI